jgi:hypothetical protein
VKTLLTVSVFQFLKILIKLQGLDAAGRCFVEKEGDLTLDKVRTLKKGEAIAYLRQATVLKGKKNVPFLTRDVFKSPGYRLGTLSNDLVPSSMSQDEDILMRPPPIEPEDHLNLSFSQPAIPTYPQPEVTFYSICSVVNSFSVVPICNFVFSIY